MALSLQVTSVNGQATITDSSGNSYDWIEAIDFIRGIDGHPSVLYLATSNFSASIDAQDSTTSSRSTTAAAASSDAASSSPAVSGS